VAVAADVAMATLVVAEAALVASIAALVADKVSA